MQQAGSWAGLCANYDPEVSELEHVHRVAQELILNADDSCAGLIAALSFDQVHELFSRVDIGLLKGASNDHARCSELTFP